MDCQPREGFAMSDEALESSANAAAFRRRVVIGTMPLGDATLARAALEDDFHHFRVELRVDAGRVTHAGGSAPRHPYSLCRAASDELVRLVGMPIERVAHAVTRYTDASEQCTH